jgi:hypothetical protein
MKWIRSKTNLRMSHNDACLSNRRVFEQQMTSGTQYGGGFFHEVDSAGRVSASYDFIDVLLRKRA